MKRKRVTITMLAILMTMVPCYAAHAANIPLAQEESVSINSLGSNQATISLSGDTTTAEGRAYGTNTEKITITVFLQKYDGGKWTTVKSWNKTSASSTVSLKGSKSVGKGKYRTRVKSTFYKGNSKESLTKCSTSVTR